MKFSKRVDDAVRLIGCLSKDCSVMAMTQLSRDVSIPYHHLTKIVCKLSKMGVVETTRGKLGGVRLVQDLARVSMKDLMDGLEEPVQLVYCHQAHRSCDLEATCQLKVPFSRLQGRLNAVLDETSIDEMISEGSYV